MANEKRLFVLDYNAMREKFGEEFRATMELIRNGETHLDNLAEGFTEADRVLRKMITMNAVDIVRCKDCVMKEKPQGYGDLQCRILGVAMNDDDFCSYGERKDGNA